MVGCTLNNPSLHCFQMHPGEKQVNWKSLLKNGYSKNELIGLTGKRSNAVSTIKFRIRSLEIRRPERLPVQVRRIENTNFNGLTFKIHESQILVTTRDLPSTLGHKAY